MRLAFRTSLTPACCEILSTAICGKSTRSKITPYGPSYGQSKPPPPPPPPKSSVLGYLWILFCLCFFFFREEWSGGAGGQARDKKKTHAEGESVYVHHLSALIIHLFFLLFHISSVVCVTCSLMEWFVVGRSQRWAKEKCEWCLAPSCGQKRN